MNASTGTSWYIGCPASGKTTLARAHAIRAAKRNGWPVLVIDTEGVAQLAGIPRVRTVLHAIRRVFVERKSASFMPNDAAEVSALLERARRPGRVNLLVDEAHVWLSARSAVTDPLLRLMRAHRHAKVNLFLTTQHLSGDIPQAALACSPVLHVFRCTSPSTLDRLEKCFSLPRERVRALRQFRYLRVCEGFAA